ncbi:MAG TPA: cell envelope integrity protein CreD, partial [Panacibacter sp.]|nr:cell envelope integrity protein CreD [Panacibacter sp.]
MNEKLTDNKIATSIWLGAWITFSLGVFVFALAAADVPGALFFLFGSAIASCIGSAPALVVLNFVLKPIKRKQGSVLSKFTWLVLLLFFITLLYGIAAAFIDQGFPFSPSQWQSFLSTMLICTGILVACNAVAFVLNFHKIAQYFSQLEGEAEPAIDYSMDYKDSIAIPQNQIKTNMETSREFQQNSQQQSSSNKIMIKAIITGVLILAMLIPSLFVSSLVTEREQRQKEVVQEVSSKWALRQTVTAPYLFIPYTVSQTAKDGKVTKVQEHLLLLPENLSVEGSITPEERPRSIYKVLLYKSSTTSKGNFLLQIPKDIDTASLQLSEARICMGITDFKGIEEKIIINLNGNIYDLGAGLPTGEIDTTGLSAQINLSLSDIGKSITFNMPIKIKGSEQLHFVPLAGNSRFNIQSTWNSPSFDGNVLPGERTVTDSGFTAQWTFSKANLPFGTMLKDFKFGKENFAFGVTMVQPADQYAKTMRSVKYAILFIGLTFCLFFIIELM